MSLLLTHPNVLVLGSSDMVLAVEPSCHIQYNTSSYGRNPVIGSEEESYINPFHDASTDSRHRDK